MLDITNHINPNGVQVALPALVTNTNITNNSMSNNIRPPSPSKDASTTTTTMQIQNSAHVDQSSSNSDNIPITGSDDQRNESAQMAQNEINVDQDVNAEYEDDGEDYYNGSHDGEGEAMMEADQDFPLQTTVLLEGADGGVEFDAAMAGAQFYEDDPQDRNSSIDLDGE